MPTAGPNISQQLQHLEKHLQQENPVLLSTVQSFRELDKVAYKIGLLDTESSYATQIPWWPLISILGTFSAGKSTFINHYLQHPLQRSGNQAVDDKFTVICFSREQTAHALPGVALDADPRFPFYQISNEIEQVAEGEGGRIDSYLQLKTCPSESVRGKIIIDSPGFDADAQRTGTLRITDHIIGLSDLVLVFFDARHPEPGAMQDTLRHLVGDTISRNDAGKFLYILNQLDTTAREDNPEDVVAAWQRALGEKGLTAGRFYTIYNPDAAVPIDDEALKARFERRRDEDMGEIHARMQQVEIERAYRIVGALEKTAKDIEDKALPALRELLQKWKSRTLIFDGAFYLLLIIGGIFLSNTLGYWQGLSFNPPWMQELLNNPTALYISGISATVLLIAIHYLSRFLATKTLKSTIQKANDNIGIRANLVLAFQRSTRFWKSIFSRNPTGWGRRSRKQLSAIINSTDKYVQQLNDTFTNPSGEDFASAQNSATAEVETETVSS